MKFQSGFISIIGMPNVGKSTLLNRLAGEKIAIVSPKPQTTRNTIRMIVTEDAYQAIFLDTPGWHEPTTKLDEYMLHAAKQAAQDTDLILYMIDAEKHAGKMHLYEENRKILTQILRAFEKGAQKAKLLLVINKVDAVQKEKILELIQLYTQTTEFDAVIPISAITGDGLDILKDEIHKRLPEGPKYFPDDTLTDQPERVIVSEIIREKMLRLMEQEVPHGVGVEVTSFKQRKTSAGQDIVDVQATIYCNKESHKAIIIGKNGAMLKRIGMHARTDSERFLGVKVFLQMHVKVKTSWQNNAYMLRQLGYDDK